MTYLSNNKIVQHKTADKQNTKASEEHDVSVIAESLDLSHKNVAQIAFVLENGSDNVKNLLVNECNIIYECRVCVNMFRSFGNFVAHKRLYCKGHECERMVLYDPSWFKPKNVETVEVVQQEKKVNSNDSIEPENTNKTNQTKSKSPNSNQPKNSETVEVVQPENNEDSNKSIRPEVNKTNQIKSPNEVSNKKRKRNSIDSNLNSQPKLQNILEKTNGIPESSFYSNEPSRNTISITSTTAKDKEKLRETSKIQSKRITRQCVKKAASSRIQESSKSTYSNINGSIVNKSKEKPSTRSKESSSIDTNGVENSQERIYTPEPLIIRRHFHHHHQPEPISSPSATSTTNNKKCTKKPWLDTIHTQGE